MTKKCWTHRKCFWCSEMSPLNWKSIEKSTVHEFDRRYPKRRCCRSVSPRRKRRDESVTIRHRWFSLSSARCVTTSQTKGKTRLNFSFADVLLVGVVVICHERSTNKFINEIFYSSTHMNFFSPNLKHPTTRNEQNIFEEGRTFQRHHRTVDDDGRPGRFRS